MQLYPPNFVYEGRSFNEAWEQAVRYCLKNGMILKPEEEAKQLTRDMCSKITLYGNGIEDIFEGKLHPKFPTKGLHLAQYKQEYTREWVEEQKRKPEKERFVYNYMDRFINYPTDYGWTLDQIHHLKENLQDGISRRHQIITWIPTSDMYSESPPCCQRIWVRRLNDEDCEIHFDWRSRDLFGAWQSNLVGLFDMFKREIFEPLSITPIKFVDNVNSLHIYESDWVEAYKV